jgi:uncharacterized membrane protein YfcA
MEVGVGIFTISLPIAGIQFNILLLITIGFCVGTLGGFFGVGGGWIVTPALNIFGFHMPFAIGTDLAHIFGNTTISTRKHSRLGNVDWRLGMLSVIGSIIGIEIGKQTILALEKVGDAGPVVRWTYMVFLFGLGAYMIYEYATVGKKAKKSAESSEPAEAISPAAMKIRKLNLPPYVSLPASGVKRISFWALFTIFLMTGFLSGFMGVGGGFILLPALIYLIGCPTTVAVGTSLLSVCFMSGYGCFTYSLSGRTEFVASIFMLMGAAIGSQIGVLATCCIRGYGIRLLFSIMIILAGASVALKQAATFLNMTTLSTLAGYTVMGAACGMTLLIFVRLIIGYKTIGRG